MPTGSLQGTQATGHPAPQKCIHSKAQAKKGTPQNSHKRTCFAPRSPPCSTTSPTLHNCTQPLTCPTLQLIHLGIPTTQPIPHRQTLRRPSTCPRTREREARTGAEERTRTSEKYPSLPQATPPTGAPIYPRRAASRLDANHVATATRSVSSLSRRMARNTPRS